MRTLNLILVLFISVNSFSTDKLFKKADWDVKSVLNDRTEFYGSDFFAKSDPLSLKKTNYKDDLQELIIQFKPEVVAISALTLDFDFICALIQPLKKQYGFKVVFGGVHALTNPDETLSMDLCDFLCKGEGETPIVNLLSALENGSPLEDVKGIWFKKGNNIEAFNNIIKNDDEQLTDLSTLPLPDYTLFDPIHMYRPFGGKRYKMINIEIYTIMNMDTDQE